MSGIEVAGLVLGAIPLIISALEHYKATRNLWVAALQKAFYIDRLIEALEDQKALIESDLSLVLLASGFDEADIGSMDADACLVLLTKENVIGEVSDYLGNMYEHYTKALIRCQTSLVNITKDIEGLALGPRVRCMIFPLSISSSLLIEFESNV